MTSLPRTVLLASPRSFCAGVERAIEIVELALAQRGAPVDVRKQIVHNAHVVGDLETRGAVFVEELDEVPDGATVVFSAHGVSPAVRVDAARRGLSVIDATCPLVTKVHAEARRAAARGDTIVLIGHAGHEEVDGTLGEAPAQTVLVAELTDRFPDATGPGAEDICYATTNRQNAVAAIAAEADLVLVVGSVNSSNSVRLVEVCRRRGIPAHLIDDAAAIQPLWLDGVATVGLSAGASGPQHLVEGVIAYLRGLGPVEVVERRVTVETIQFGLPKQVRPSQQAPTHLTAREDAPMTLDLDRGVTRPVHPAPARRLAAWPLLAELTHPETSPTRRTANSSPWPVRSAVSWSTGCARPAGT